MQHLTDLADTRRRIADEIVGRERELELLLTVVGTGRDVVLEGPPGTSKTTMLKAITGQWGIPLLFVQGNADLTPGKLIGHHNPVRVLREDYSPDNFVPGPLLEAMQSGGFLYLEEFNRTPEDTLNTLLTAMADRRITVPRVGTVVAEPSFRVIASMNPADDIGTTRLSAGIYDRLCRLAVGYQDAPSEEAIVSLRAAAGLVALPAGLQAKLTSDAVAVTRATRAHTEILQGSSVRGAIDCVLVGTGLAALRGIDAQGEPYDTVLLDVMLVSLSGRIRLDDASEATPEQVLREIWAHHLLLERRAAPG